MRHRIKMKVGKRQSVIARSEATKQSPYGIRDCFAALAMTVFILTLLALPPRASAQTQEPFVFLTWRADSYAPPDFRGKVLPTAYTRVSVAVEAISGGKTLDLSRATVNWYWDNGLVATGQGMKRTSVNAGDIPNTAHDLRVEISGLPDGLLLKTVEVPVVRPEVMIEAPFPDRTFSGNNIVLVAKPYFWNSVPGLIFNWKVNGQAPEGEDNSGVLRANLNPGVAPGFEVKTELNVYSPANPLESATKTLSLIFNP